jgi:uncharacterized iron-regulated protein
MTISRAFALLLLAATPAWADDAPPAFKTELEGAHPLTGRIWQPASGRFLSPGDLMAEAGRADAVLLGETHDNPDHHALQAWVVERLTVAGPRPAVAFEMIDADQRPALEAYLTAHPGDAAGLGAAVEWNRRGWPDWTLYRPIAAAVLKAGGPVRPASLPRDLTRKISRAEEPVELAARLGLDQPLATEDAAAMAEDIRASHCNMLPESAVAGMVRTQRARDAEMASVLAGLLAAGHRPAVLIAGAGHVRADRAVPPRLAALVPGARVLALAFVEVQPGEDDPAAYGQAFGAPRLPFSAVWFTPRSARADQCAEFAKHMKAKK